MDVMARADRMIVRFCMLFLRLESLPCSDPACRCKRHDVLVVSRFGWCALVAWSFMIGVFACCIGRH